MTLLSLAALAFAVAYAGTVAVRRAALRHGILDMPNPRSSHQRPTPRGGGVAIVAAFTVGMLAASLVDPSHLRMFGGLMVCALAVAVLGFLDDLRGLSGSVRIAVWTIIAGTSMALGIRLEAVALPVIGVISLGALSPVATFVWLVGLTNFYNFMDGIDGMAGGTAVIVAGFLGLAALRYDNTPVLVTSVIVLGSALGFLLHNLPPARIFMGDAGSTFLGFVFAALAIVGSAGRAAIPFVVPVLLLGTFLFDATITLLRRMPRGKEWLEPHRDHYYQRLVIRGCSHRQVTALYWLINVVLGGLALLYTRTDGVAALVLLAAALLPLLCIPVVIRTLNGRRTAT